jgi:hypothetical protein
MTHATAKIMDTDKIHFLATAEAYELINSSDADQNIQYVLEKAFKLYENVRHGIKVGDDGTGLTSGHLPLSIYARWAKFSYEKDLILICKGGCAPLMMGLIWKGRDVLADALETAIPMITH